MSKQIYDKSAVYQNEVLPLLEQLQAVCNQHDLPVFALVATQYDGERHEAACLSYGDSARMPDSMAVLMGIVHAGGGDMLDYALRMIDEWADAKRQEQRKAMLSQMAQ